MYGGSFENRMRFVIEIYNAIREAVGPKFVVGIRLSVDEFIEGGNTLEDGIKIAKVFSDLGVDFIDVSCGLQETAHLNREPPSFQQGWKKNLAKSVKAVVKCPVIAVNTIKKPDFAESLLEEGVCDFIGLSRPHLSDPFWSKKAKEGKEEEIRTCISCLNCFDTLAKGLPPTCAVNPAVGRELEFEKLNMNGNGKVVAVIGGGPGGMEAAQILAKRGFTVTLFEKDSELGGQLNLANKPPMKEKITWLKEGMEAQVRNAGVNVLLNTEATVEKIKELNPVAVFCCVGSVPIRPSSILGINRENVFTVPDVLEGKVQLNNKEIVIVGTGLSGLECGNYLAHRGCKLTFVEMNSQVGQGIFVHVFADEMKELETVNPQFYLKTKLNEIKPDGVKCVDESGKEIEVKADAVVLAMGVTPRRDLVKIIKDNFDNVIIVGDANQSGRILEATTDGFTKAWVFE
jgi:NADPH-dependent 2,4-dienoyl-CoA reductase/sulfur reductase-like enzyme